MDSGTLIEAFFDTDTSTISYIVSCSASGEAAVIDSVLDFEHASGRTRSFSADSMLDYIHLKGLTVHYILETHAHADHLSAAPYLQEKLRARQETAPDICIGSHITQTQSAFARMFDMENSFTKGKNAFDRLLADGDQLVCGSLMIDVLHTPGHTPACVSYHIRSLSHAGRDQAGQAGCLFVGDTLFMPDSGTARTDFPGGDAGTLYDSIQKLLSFPDETRLFICHDYQPGGRLPAWETTVAEQKQNNIHISQTISQTISRADFIRLRTARDKTLTQPRLIIPSIQVNINAGRLPEASENGVQYLKVPLNQL